MTIVGSDPVGKDNSQGDDSEGPKGYADHPGAHRFIGIGMVLGLAFVILILWLSFGRWPRRQIRKWWLKPEPDSSEESQPDVEKPRFVDEIILPKEPEKAKACRSGSGHRGQQHAVASWETEIDYRVSWEMKQHGYYEPGSVVVPPNRSDYMAPERRAGRSRS